MQIKRSHELLIPPGITFTSSRRDIVPQMASNTFRILKGRLWSHCLLLKMQPKQEWMQFAASLPLKKKIVLRLLRHRKSKASPDSKARQL